MLQSSMLKEYLDILGKYTCLLSCQELHEKMDTTLTFKLTHKAKSTELEQGGGY